MNRKLIDVLLELHKNQRSGILRAERGTAKQQLVVNQGLLVFAESNLPEQHLARILVGLNILQHSKIKEIAELMKAGKSSEQAVLAVSGPGTQNLEKGRHEQAVAILASLLRPENCVLRFYTGENLVKNQLNLRMALPDLILLSADRAIAGRMIEPPPGLLSGKFVVPDDAATKGSYFRLKGAELRILSHAKDGRTPGEILPLIDVENPGQLLLRLLVLGLLQISADQKKEAAEPESDSLIRELDSMLVRFESSTPYQMLSVASNAGQEEIQAAYHDLAKRLHPDRFQSDEFPPQLRGKAQQVFVQINEAYLTLKNPVSRALYDETATSSVKAPVDSKARTPDPEEAAEALFRDGRTALIHGDFSTAVQRFRSCVWLCPEKASYNHYLGVAESELPNFRKKAEQHLLKAIELEDVSAESHLELAKLYIKVALPIKAEYQLQQAMHFDPENREIRNLRAQLEKLR